MRSAWWLVYLLILATMIALFFLVNGLERRRAQETISPERTFQVSPSILRTADIPFYNFKEPRPGVGGFAWTDVWKDIAAEGQGANDWQKAKGEQVVEMLKHPIAVDGFRHDWRALFHAQKCMLVMPCGRSAHLETGYAIGSGKPTVVLLDAESEAELMWKMADLVTVSLDEAVAFLQR